MTANTLGAVGALGIIDFAVLITYLVAIVGIGCYAGMRSRRGVEGGREYFLAGGSLRWPMIGLALFSTNISTIHLVGFAQEGYNNGLAYGNYEWMAPFLLIVLALFFAPFYIRYRVTTLPDFLERRYSRGCRDWLAFISIISAIFIHIGFTLYMGAVVLEGLLGIPIMVSVTVAALLTGLYTIVGGLMAVVVTESIQTIILLIGSIIITIVAYFQVGGWEGLTANVEPVKLTMLRSADDPANLPWYSVFLGYPIIGLWYWCADQTIVQRVLGARSENDARVGPLFAGFIKILPVFIFVLPGVMLVGLINKGAYPELADSKDAYAYLINNVLPTGLTGVMAAALLAALMSTVSGALNSIATLFSYDLYKRWRPDTPDKKLVLIGRIATFVAMIVAILWSPLIARFEGMYQGCVALICYVAPPITAVFVLGVFWKRASSTGALATLIIGSLLGFIVFLLDWFKDFTGWSVPPMLASFFLCMTCIGIQVFVSILKPHQHTAESQRLVWSNPLEALQGQAWKGLGNYKILSAVLFVVMVGLYFTFSILHPRQPDNPSNAQAGLQVAYYQGDWDEMPVFEELSPVKSSVVNDIVLPEEKSEKAIALNFTGFLDVPTEGKYTFYVKSNEMYKMYFGPIKLNFRDLDIEEKPEQESIVKEQKADIDLQAGKHQFTFVYFEEMHQEGVLPFLEVMFKGPGINKTELSESMMFHVSEGQ